jgi:hypothetical protein
MAAHNAPGMLIQGPGTMGGVGGRNMNTCSRTCEQLVENQRFYKVLHQSLSMLVSNPNCHGWKLIKRDGPRASPHAELLSALRWGTVEPPLTDIRRQGSCGSRKPPRQLRHSIRKVGKLKNDISQSTELEPETCDSLASLTQVILRTDGRTVSSMQPFTKHASLD